MKHHRLRLEKLIKQALERVGLLAVILDSQGKMTFCNNFALEVCGWSRQEIMGCDWFERFLPAEVRDDLKALYREKFSSGGFPSRYENELITTGGKRRLIAWHNTFLRDEEGNVICAVSIGEDITEARLAQKRLIKAHEELERKVEERTAELVRVNEQLRQSRSLYRSVVQDQTELINRFTPDGTVLFINDACCRYFNKDRGEFLGKRFMPFVPEEDRKIVEGQLASLTAENPVGTCEHRVLLPSGETRWQQWTNRAIFNEEGCLVEFQSVGRDVTERKMLDESLRKAYAEQEKKIEERTAELAKKTRLLEEMNTALKVLLRQREEDKRRLEEDVLANVKALVFPYIEKLARSRLDDEQALYLGILESHLADVTSPFMGRLSREMSGLTPAEMEVAGLIREGKRTKEIAHILNLSKHTVVSHRYHIRTKLKLKNKKVNLRSYLQSLAKK
ncbi:MAG: PAS domain S-box protein [Desulfoferrobacter sp.]